MKKLLHFTFTISLLSLATACIPANKIDVEACKKKTDPCEEYHCLFPGCWCLPNEEGRLILFDAKKEISNLNMAKALAEEYLQEEEIEASALQVAEDAYGWFYMVFQKENEEFHYSISPKGQICQTECGV